MGDLTEVRAVLASARAADTAAMAASAARYRRNLRTAEHLLEQAEYELKLAEIAELHAGTPFALDALCGARRVVLDAGWTIYKEANKRRTKYE